MEGDANRARARLAPALPWYRARRMFARNWPGYLSIIVLFGLVGGLGMGTIAAARRTASSFTTFWHWTRPSDLQGGTGILNPRLGLKPYDPSVIAAIAALPHVSGVNSATGLNVLPLLPDGSPNPNIAQFSPGPGNGYGSDGATFFSADKVAVLQGHLADPSDPYEFMLSAGEAQAMDLHVGSVVRFGVYTNSEFNLPGFGTPRVKPYRVIHERLAGIAIANTAVIQDQSDEGSAPNNFFTPALTRQLRDCCANYTETGLAVSGGAKNVPIVQAEITHALARFLAKGVPQFQVTAPSVVPKAQRSLRPAVIALAAFGGIVLLACLLIVGQVTGRQIAFAAGEKDVLRALGATPRQTWADALPGILGSLALGALLAVAVAVGLSPIAPLGPVRPVYPRLGLSFDWTVLGLGAAALVLVLSAVAAAQSYWSAPHRAAYRAVVGQPGSRFVWHGASWGLPPPALTGIHFALASGRGRTSVPVRSAVLGAVLAVAALVGTVTFASSLTTLVSHPALYGWNWDYMLVAGANLPEHRTTTLLEHDNYVSAWSGVYEAALQLDGLSVPVLGEAPGSTVAPAILSGHGLEAADQVVLGTTTMSQLHTHIGGTVRLTANNVTAARPVLLHVVGTATLPAFGTPPHTEMSTGAVISYHLIPALELNLFNNPDAGPQAELLRLKPEVSREQAVASLRRVAEETTTPQNFGVGVVGVQRPAEILNYRALGATPAYLGGGLAAGAVGALALTLVASVRRRRRELALLKTLGFTEGQVAAAVVWQSTTSVTIGLAAGVPIGIALGRWLWDLFARDIGAVPAPSVPMHQVLLIVAGALVLANLVAAVPARLAARTPTARVLRTQ